MRCPCFNQITVPPYLLVPPLEVPMLLHQVTVLLPQLLRISIMAAQGLLRGRGGGRPGQARGHRVWEGIHVRVRQGVQGEAGEGALQAMWDARTRVEGVGAGGALVIRV